MVQKRGDSRIMHDKLFKSLSLGLVSFGLGFFGFRVMNNNQELGTAMVICSGFPICRDHRYIK